MLEQRDVFITFLRIWKHVQSLGMQDRYNDEQEFALHFRIISAVAFLPAKNDVINGFDDLCVEIRDLYKQRRCRRFVRVL